MIEIFESTDKFPLQKIGKMAGVCWGSPIEDPEKNIKRAKECILSGHGRVLEFIDIEMCISKVSARVIREWYTHIGGAPTRLQESTRYVNCENFDYVIPPFISNLGEATSSDKEVAAAEYHKIMENIKESYHKLTELGMPREDAANILPLGMSTKIVDKRNLRNLIEMSHQRLCTRAYWEYRKLMKDIVKALSEYSDEWKWIVENLFKPKCEVCGYCTEKKSCGRKPNQNAQNSKR